MIVTPFANNFLRLCFRHNFVGRADRTSIQFSESCYDTCRCPTTEICQYIAVDQRLAIRKLLSSDYNAHKLAPTTRLMEWNLVTLLHAMQWRRFMLEIGGTSAEGASMERRRRYDRGAEGTDGVGCGEGLLFSILGLEKVSFGAFWVLLLQLN